MPAIPPSIQTRLRSHCGGEEATESRAQEMIEREALKRRRLLEEEEEGNEDEKEGEKEGAERKSEQT